MQWLLALAAFATIAVPIGLLYKPLGSYMAWVFTSPRHGKLESAVYRLIGVDPDKQQTWQAYLCSVLSFSFVGVVLLYVLQRLQPWLPYSLGLPSVRPDTAFNTAASFVANTNWQSYVPEETMGYSVQMGGLAVQNFVCAAVGIAVAIALVRGLAYHRRGTIGNFWCDVVRGNLRLLLPMAMIAAIVFLSTGVIQNFAGFHDVATLAGGVQTIPGGPVASQQAISMLGTNGGGFFNGNCAHPFESPNAFANLFQVFCLLVIPFTLPRTFGKIVHDDRMGYMILATMVGLFVIAFGLITMYELAAAGVAPLAAGGAMEGKEQRFGIVGSTLFAAATTGTSGGASNSMHDSYTALGGLVLMMHMLLGEVSPGGVGAGLYSLLTIAVLAVFMTGMLLGRTPVMLGKRIGTTETKLAGIFVLVLPVLSLGGLGLSMAIPAVRAEIVDQAMKTGGPHGMSEVIYTFISVTINNGSSFAGFSANTPYLNVILGLLILLGRFIPIALVLALAGSFAKQDQAPSQQRALPLHTPQFVIWLMVLVIYIAIPTFMPLLMAGPLAEALH